MTIWGPTLHKKTFGGRAFVELRLCCSAAPLGTQLNSSGSLIIRTRCTSYVLYVPNLLERWSSAIGRCRSNFVDESLSGAVSDCLLTLRHDDLAAVLSATRPIGSTKLAPVTSSSRPNRSMVISMPDCGLLLMVGRRSSTRG